MTAEEVTVVHVAEREESAESSSKVDTVVEENNEKKEMGKEDISNGANGMTGKEETDGETDYVIVEGSDGANGDPMESDLEKNGNGIAGEDPRVEKLEIKGEVKSESQDNGSSIGIVDQEKEPIELCQVEGPLIEQKTGDLVDSDPVSGINVGDGVSETSMPDQNGFSEPPEAVSDSNGDSPANVIAERTVSEDAAVDSSAKQGAEVLSIPDNNNLVNGSVDNSVVDIRLEENGNLEIPGSEGADGSGPEVSELNDPAPIVSHNNGASLEAADNNGASLEADTNVADNNGDSLEADINGGDSLEADINGGDSLEDAVVDSSAEQSDDNNGVSSTNFSVEDRLVDTKNDSEIASAGEETECDVAAGDVAAGEDTECGDVAAGEDTECDVAAGEDTECDVAAGEDTGCDVGLGHEENGVSDGQEDVVSVALVGSEKNNVDYLPIAVNGSLQVNDVVKTLFENEAPLDDSKTPVSAVVEKLVLNETQSAFEIAVNETQLAVVNDVDEASLESEDTEIIGDNSKTDNGKVDEDANSESGEAGDRDGEKAIEAGDRDDDDDKASEAGDTDHVSKKIISDGAIRFGSLVEAGSVDEVEKKKPFYYLIRVPRYEDEDLKEKIRLAQIRVNEKTKSRDAIGTELQSMKATCKEYGEKFHAAKAEESVARDLFRSKRQEIESIQSVINIEDIGGRIQNNEHRIQHETLSLKEEKELIREIKQLKQVREKLSSNMGKQDEVQQGLDEKDQTEKRLKSLKKEADQLRDNIQKAEAVTKAAKKKYNDETEKLNALQKQFRDANEIRQEAFAQFQGLKKQSYEKYKSFSQCREDAKKAKEAMRGDKEAFQNLCVNQVERVMELWNNNDEFRKEYVRFNVQSTLRRLQTLDGRALGPNEEPPVIPQVVVNERAHTVSSSTLEEQTQEKLVLPKAEKPNTKPMAKAAEQKNQTSNSEKPVKSVPLASGSTTASTSDENEETREEKPKMTKEEEEAARRAEALRKEEELARLREQRRLDEIAKAKEAIERKKRNAEKAQARAVFRAQKEAEQKEKEREKRARKKERRKVAGATVGDASVAEEVELAPTPETPAETTENEMKEKPVTVAKKSQKPSQFKKQSKTKSIPPPLRNRGKRKMQPWMWVLLITLVIFALFFVGNSNIFFNLGLQRFNTI